MAASATSSSKKSSKARRSSASRSRYEVYGVVLPLDPVVPYGPGLGVHVVLEKEELLGGEEARLLRVKPPGAAPPPPLPAERSLGSLPTERGTYGQRSRRERRSVSRWRARSPPAPGRGRSGGGRIYSSSFLPLGRRVTVASLVSSLVVGGLDSARFFGIHEAAAAPYVEHIYLLAAFDALA